MFREPVSGKVERVVGGRRVERRERVTRGKGSIAHNVTGWNSLILSLQIDLVMDQ